MDEIDLVIEKLKDSEIFFFAGSGISYASNLPSAYAILEHTVNALLPTDLTAAERRNICDSIQPEIFYESVIEITQTYDALNIWKSLYKEEQEKHGVECEPNLSHLFIVEYSYKNQLPIFTTNFDTMFEEAAEFLGIKYNVFLPSDDPPKLDEELLCICKLHGSIRDCRGEYSPQSLWTTMTQITMVNTIWIEYICSIMSQKHLCFVGYSGRDIDLFPYLSEAPRKRGAKRIIWINRFDGDHSDIVSKACNALRVHKWPSELFELSLNKLGISKFPSKIQKNSQENKLKRLLDYLEIELAHKKLLSTSEKKLLYCILLAKLGEYRRAYKLASDIERYNLSHIPRPLTKHLLLLTCARLSHEVSRYDSCRSYANLLLTELRNRSESNIDDEIQARCLISESLRMGIPNDIYFPKQKRLNDYLYVLYVIGHFIYTSIINSLTISFRGTTFSKLQAETKHELIEHRIRFYALIQSVLGSPQRGWNKYVKKFLIRRWECIKQISYRTGYAAGIANSGKFKYRLNPLEEIKSESTNIYSLTTSATGLELFTRNEADQLLRNKQYGESRKKYIKYLVMARKSGNTLNEIKGIVGYAYSNYMEGLIPLLPNSLKKRYRKLVNMVEGKRWRDYFVYLEKNYFNSN